MNPGEDQMVWPNEQILTARKRLALQPGTAVIAVFILWTSSSLGKKNIDCRTLVLAPFLVENEMCTKCLALALVFNKDIASFWKEIYLAVCEFS